MNGGKLAMPSKWWHVARSVRPLYLIPVLSKSLDVLQLLQTEAQPMTTDQVCKKTGISKATA
jgi:ribose transport system substrate-binding protein